MYCYVEQKSPVLPIETYPYDIRTLWYNATKINKTFAIGLWSFVKGAIRKVITNLWFCHL